MTLCRCALGSAQVRVVAPAQLTRGAWSRGIETDCLRFKVADRSISKAYMSLSIRSGQAAVHAAWVATQGRRERSVLGDERLRLRHKLKLVPASSLSICWIVQLSSHLELSLVLANAHLAACPLIRPLSDAAARLTKRCTPEPHVYRLSFQPRPLYTHSTEMRLL